MLSPREAEMQMNKIHHWEFTDEEMKLGKVLTQMIGAGLISEMELSAQSLSNDLRKINDSAKENDEMLYDSWDQGIDKQV